MFIKKTSVALLCILGGVLTMRLFSSSHLEKKLSYPCSLAETHEDSYHGTVVKDPYRYLEDSEREETKQWIAAQNLFTLNYLKTIPERDLIYERLQTLWNYERVGLVLKKGDRYFVSKNSGLQNQPVLYTFQKNLSEDAEVLLDPNTLSVDGTVALQFSAPSEEGRFLAYGLSKAGSDWTEIFVLDVETKQELPDHIEWVKFSTVSWLPDSSGFYYSRYEKPRENSEYLAANTHQKLYFHKMGSSQEEDLLVYERADQKEWLFSAEVSESGDYLIVSIAKGSAAENGVLYKRIALHEEFQELFMEFDAQYEYIGNEGPFFWFKTNKDAFKGKVIRVDLSNPREQTDIILETEDTLQSASMIGDLLVLTYLHNAHSKVVFHTLEGHFKRELSIPLGTVAGFAGKKSEKEAFYLFTSFTSPATIYKYDFSEEKSELFFQPNFPASLEDYEVRQSFYKSKDGTRVPLFLVGRKDLALSGKNRVLLMGYGGFDVSITPFFSVETAVWLEMGGVFAVANIRGGGEYGASWHEAGKLQNKQNVFNDFIAAAEWLIAEKITSPSHLSIYGGSNGGLLVGACLTQRPELFGAAIPAVGVLDMLRYHKFTIGWAWVPEYGSSEDPLQFPFLYKYSPLHNIQIGKIYPPTLILTADHDDRVVPSHSFKFAATLQHAQEGSAPVLIRIETSAGHGSGKPTTKQIEQSADKLAFLAKHLRDR